jgi:hypothetical protein
LTRGYKEIFHHFVKLCQAKSCGCNPHGCGARIPVPYAQKTQNR